MNVLSLFDGISCARVALDRAEIPVDKYYASEVDKYAIQIAQKNYPDTIQLGSVVGLTPPERIDLLVGGSPCQDLSIAKKDRKGLNGERSGLFWEYVRILKEAKPKYFILENVNSMPKEAKAIISKALGVEPVMINAALVSAQNRKRLFWVGKLDEFRTYRQVNIPQPEDRNIFLRDILEEKVDEKYFVKPKSNTVRSSGRGSGVDDKHNWDTIRIGTINSGGQGDRIYSPEGKSVGLSALGGGRGAKTGLYAVALTETRTEEAKKIRRESMANGRDYSPRRGKELVTRIDGKSNTITTGQTKESLILENKSYCIPSTYYKENTKSLIKRKKKGLVIGSDVIIRKLTPIECERLQSLPKNYTEGVSNTQRYKALGNAFNVEVVAHILKHLTP